MFAALSIKLILSIANFAVALVQEPGDHVTPNQGALFPGHIGTHGQSAYSRIYIGHPGILTLANPEVLDRTPRKFDPGVDTSCPGVFESPGAESNPLQHNVNATSYYLAGDQHDKKEHQSAD